jgi:hypothetical protein
MHVILNSAEIAEIDRQDPSREGDGGFQGLLVRFQKRIDRPTGRLELTPQDIQRIQNYAAAKSGGGWENQLRRAFQRTLGPNLDGNP